MFRSARLEALFGKRLDQVTFADVHALVGREEAAEAGDLDYKELVHAKSDEQKVEFCKDVVAMANDRGGVLIIGVKEDGARAIPEKVTKVDVTDGEQRRLRNVLLNTAPHPLPVDVLPLDDPDDAGRGVLLVVVERSALAPHALLDTRDKTHHRDGWLRFPVRNGAATRWMLEPEVATRYRDRFVQGRSVQDRLDEVEVECLLAYEERDIGLEPVGPAAMPGGTVLHPTAASSFLEDESEPARPVLAVTVVPEIAGRLTINRAALLEFSAPSTPNRCSSGVRSASSGRRSHQAGSSASSVIRPSVCIPNCTRMDRGHSSCRFYPVASQTAWCNCSCRTRSTTYCQD